MTGNENSYITNRQELFGRLPLQSPEAVDFEMEIAGIGARSHAFVIDWHIRVLLAFAWFLVAVYTFSSWSQISQLVWEKHEITGFYFILIPPIVIYFLYHPVMEIAMAGHTPGKRIAGVRLVTLQGMTPGAGALLLRNVFRLLDCLPVFYVVGLATVALTRHQVRIGDMAGGLVLVYAEEIRQKEFQRAAGLALHSLLSPEDQSILLDVLKRWEALKIEARIGLAERFLKKLEVPPPPQTDKRKKYSKALQEKLQQMLNHKPDIPA